MNILKILRAPNFKNICERLLLWRGFYQPFKYQPYQMVKHTQQFVGKLPTNCLNVFDHFVRLVLKS